MIRHLAVNVDIDSLNLYYGIHGMDPSAASEASWDTGIPRFMELFDSLGLRATFFVVASDLERPVPRQRIKELVSAGHEIASHTWSHPYNLIHQSEDAIAEEIRRSEDLLSDVRGSRIVGFRAPGYNISETVLDILAERGYAYDSSMFPCPPYYLARALVIGQMKLRGRESQSIVGDWKAPFTSRNPSVLRTRSGGTIVEYPMCVLPGIRFPVIGTSITMLGTAGVRFLKPFLTPLSFVNLEFHAVDLLDSSDAVGDRLPQVQSDLRVPYLSKRMLFQDVLEHCSKGAQNRTLEELSVGGLV